MGTEKRLYRSRNLLAGGVCAGIADYFSLDPVVVRILAIILTIITAGLFAVAYIALWVVLPLEPRGEGVFDVEPQSVQSENFGHMDSEEARGKTESWNASASPAYSTYCGTGHIPPEPPVVAAAGGTATTVQASSRWSAPGHQPGGFQAGYYGSWSEPCSSTPLGSETDVPCGASHAGFVPPAMPQQPSWRPPIPPVAGPPLGHAASEAATSSPRSGGVGVAVAIGAFLLFMGVAALLANFIKDVSWWQFWPLLFGFIGIVWMVVPGRAGHRMAQFVNGFILFFLSGMLLTMSLHFVDWRSLQNMFFYLWPLLVMMVGFFIIASATRASWLRLAAGFCFAAFCVIGLVWFALPGTQSVLMLSLPFEHEYVLPFTFYLD